MIRFKVVRASRLLLWLAVILLVAVICAIMLRGALSGPSRPDRASARLVEADGGEARAQAAFASSGAPQRPVGRGDGATPGMEIEVLPRAQAGGAPDESPGAPARSVLIYHTHTHEAYEQVSDDPYEALEAWRTADSDHSVVRVGEALAGHLRAHGFEVVHDATDHEGDALGTAYTRSLATLLSYDRRFDLYIDLHRDAYSGDSPPRYTAPDGSRCARVMLLIGNGNGFEEKPFYEENLAFARALTRRIERQCPGLCRDVLVKDGRYNQHVGVFSVLIEVGHNRNTLDEALNATPHVANAIYSLMIDEPDAALEAMRASR